MQRRSTFVPLLALTLVLAFVSLLALGRGPVARAQDATPTPEAEVDASAVMTDTADSMVEAESPQAYVELNLAAGFPLDPFIVSVNGGGPVDAATVADGCVGWVSENPVLTLDWEGDAELARIFFYSEHNPSVVVQGPDGAFTCAGDMHEGLLDASVQFDAPAPGRYNIWVGNEDDDALIPGVLVLTTRPEVTVGSFQLAGLVDRPVIADVLPDVTEDSVIGALIRERLAEALANDDEVEPLEEGVTITATSVITGDVPGFLLPVDEASPLNVCAGISNNVSTVTVSVPEGLPFMRVFIESDTDTTLQLLAPDGGFLCVDDSADGANRNPMIDIEAPAPGNYAVVVGRLSPDATGEATVTVTTDPELEPALLELVTSGDN
jgi:hypothetical protein